MENDLEHEIRDLAYHIWQAAQDRFGQAIDFWLMAEQMVIELTAASANLANTTATSATEAAATWPTALRALYLYRVRQLAHRMWQASTEQHERSMDYWLAAEKHMQQLMQAAARTADASRSAEERVAIAFETFSPTSYLDEIRKTAYYLWEEAGRQYGSAFDFWLAAENMIMEALASGGMSNLSKSATDATAPVLRADCAGAQDCR